MTPAQKNKDMYQKFTQPTLEVLDKRIKISESMLRPIEDAISFIRECLDTWEEYLREEPNNQYIIASIGALRKNLHDVEESYDFERQTIMRLYEMKNKILAQKDPIEGMLKKLALPTSNGGSSGGDLN